VSKRGYSGGGEGNGKRGRITKQKISSVQGKGGQKVIEDQGKGTKNRICNSEKKGKGGGRGGGGGGGMEMGLGTGGERRCGGREMANNRVKKGKNGRGGARKLPTVVCESVLRKKLVAIALGITEHGHTTYSSVKNLPIAQPKSEVGERLCSRRGKEKIKGSCLEDGKTRGSSGGNKWSMQKKEVIDGGKTAGGTKFGKN